MDREPNNLSKYENIWVKEMTWTDKKNEEDFKNWLEEHFETQNIENALTITEGILNMEEQGQIVLHFINPKLATFPGGFARLVVNSHNTFDLGEMNNLQINKSNGRKIKLYYTENKSSCKFIHVESTKEEFLMDLEDTLEYLQKIKLNKKIEINMPAVGMGLWKHKPDEVLAKFNEYSKYDNNKIIFKMYLNERTLFTKILNSTVSNFSIFFDPRIQTTKKEKLNCMEEELTTEINKLVINLSDSETETEEEIKDSMPDEENEKLKSPLCDLCHFQAFETQIYCR